MKIKASFLYHQKSVSNNIKTLLRKCSGKLVNQHVTIACKGSKIYETLKNYIFLY